jgi:hypothetical protein
MTTQGYLFYVPICLTLLAGYLGGAALAFGVHYLNWWSGLQDQSARIVVVAYGMGTLGATISSTRYWARDMEDAISKPEFLPHALDIFGYAFTILSGGITGIVLLMAVWAAPCSQSLGQKFPLFVPAPYSCSPSSAAFPNSRLKKLEQVSQQHQDLY